MNERESESSNPIREGELLTVPEAAKALRVAESTVWRWLANGSLPAFRLGGKRVLIRRADLSAVIKPARAHGQSVASRDEGQLMSEAKRTRMLAAVAASKAAFAAARARGKPSAGVSTLELLDEARRERDRDLDSEG